MKSSRYLYTPRDHFRSLLKRSENALIYNLPQEEVNSFLDLCVKRYEELKSEKTGNCPYSFNDIILFVSSQNSQL
jgi:hypothetical protein